MPPAAALDDLTGPIGVTDAAPLGERAVLPLPAWIVARWWIGLAAVLALLAGAYTWRVSGSEAGDERLDPAKLGRLPARPEEIAARGIAAHSTLAPDSARLKNAAVAFAAETPTTANPFAFTGSEDDRARAVECLAAAVLYEAGDDAVGQFAVAQVVLNRARHAAFPATVCGVVYQGAERRTGCQFTFTCDGSLRRVMPAPLWDRARAVARAAIGGRVDGTVGLATHYHTDWVYPYWSPSLNKIAKVGTHLFFGWPGAWGGPKAFLRAYPGGEATPRPMRPVEVREMMAEPAVLEPAPVSSFPPEVARVPLYGTELRLADPATGSFALLVPADTVAAKVVNAALALCPSSGPCQVRAWSDGSALPTAFPVSAASREKIVFEYTRENATAPARMRFDCAVFPKLYKGMCLEA